MPQAAEDHHRVEAKTLSRSKLTLPSAPASQSGPVKVWEEPVVLRTYLPALPDRNPLFLEKRVYQGSSGRVYPLPVIDRIDTQAQDHAWKAIHLENEYMRLMILPEIGGRLHVGLDKSNGYDFFYRQNVIKPALVGLAGPWISGGVEFNWPQHHRPATFMPVETFIEREHDGTVIVWCSDHDPMSRMKGMHGFCLSPGRACLELRVRLYNRTTDTHSFLWWANAAAHVHEKYQSFFSGDVRFVADHARRAVTEFPLSRGIYYGIDYGERASHGVAEEELPGCYVPDGSYAPNDLSWYANIPVPTSYMVVESQSDFSGGYDHARDAGVVHVANHHIAPGKKQWTWGNHEFGYAWDRNLTETDGPYVELMAGVYTDNQPDFSFLAPGETKSFSHFWYPIREIGVPDAANKEAALRAERAGENIILHLNVTRDLPKSSVRLLLEGKEQAVIRGDLSPKTPIHYRFAMCETGEVEILVEQEGSLILRHSTAKPEPDAPPEAAKEPPLPADVPTNDELFLIGLHLEQYRHPTREPSIYWREAVRRDEGDSRAHHALGRWHLRRGELAAAEYHLHLALSRLTAMNANPYDGEPFYNLGRTLAYAGRRDEAYRAFYKSTWNAAWCGPGYLRLAEIDCCRQEWITALEHTERSLRNDVDNLGARNLKVLILRKLDRWNDASETLNGTRMLDPLDVYSRFLASGEIPADAGQRLDLGFDLLRAAWLDDALRVFSEPPPEECGGGSAMLLYAQAHTLCCLGRGEEGLAAYGRAAHADSSYVFPSRLEEMLLLEEAIRLNPYDARAPYYLGNLLYDRRRHEEAIALWEVATRLDSSFPTAWRNLGFGSYNVAHNNARAMDAFARARELSPWDARLLYEQDQLAKHTGTALKQRLKALESNKELVWQRDDLSVELATLYNSTGDPEAALRVLLSRQFQPWEGGEGLVLGQYVRAQVLLGQRALAVADTEAAVTCFKKSLDPPSNLAEAWHLLRNGSMVDYWLGAAYAQQGDTQAATKHWRRAARTPRDFQQMRVQSISETTYWSGMSLLQLHRKAEARELFHSIHHYAALLEQQEPRIDYFATSLPTMLLFEEDIEERQRITVSFLKAQALAGLNEEETALSLLQEVLRYDCSHAGAIDLLGNLSDRPDGS